MLMSADSRPSIVTLQFTVRRKGLCATGDLKGSASSHTGDHFRCEMVRDHDVDLLRAAEEAVGRRCMIDRRLELVAQGSQDGRDG